MADDEVSMVDLIAIERVAQELWGKRPRARPWNGEALSVLAKQAWRNRAQGSRSPSGANRSVGHSPSGTAGAVARPAAPQRDRRCSLMRKPGRLHSRSVSHSSGG